MNFKLLTLYALCMLSPLKTDSREIQNGECIPLRLCPSLLESVNQNNSTIKFTNKLICGFNGTDLMVLCDHAKRYQRQASVESLLPDESYCGYQHSDDFEHNTESTSITEFPWLARIISKSDSDNEISYEKYYPCLGSVINNRYILSTADCASTPGFSLVEVELGDYNILNETDCVFEADIEECSDPVGSYKIEKVITYPNYSTECITNNIALIRLNQRLFFNDYIRPICLPFPHVAFPKVGDILTTSGWGFINPEGTKAVIKKRVLAELISTRDCWEKYKKQSNLIIDEKNLCVIRMENSTEMNCIGDSGSPVIFSHRLQWYQIGILSAGQGKCGDKTPAVLTRVESYLEWIKETIKP